MRQFNVWLRVKIEAASIAALTTALQNGSARLYGKLGDAVVQETCPIKEVRSEVVERRAFNSQNDRRKVK